MTLDPTGDFTPCRSRRLVIVDDDDGIRTVLAAVAHQAWKWDQIDEYHSGQLAWDDLRTREADLVITDCYMPGMNGPDLVRQLRAQHRPIPVIMVSGSDEARRLGAEAGVDRFVDKHSLIRDLRPAIHALVQSAWQEDLQPALQLA